MGRLENIIARNQQPNRPSERLIVSLVVGSIVLLILGLALFTDLGAPPEAAQLREPAAEPPANPDGKRIDGVLLRTAPAQR